MEKEARDLELMMCGCEGSLIESYYIMMRDGSHNRWQYIKSNSVVDI